MKKLLLILTLPLLLMANRCTTDTEEVENNCNTVGLVVDMTGLDGCGLMIQLEDGKRLEVVNMPEGESLHAGDEVMFDYEPADGMSICMSGEMVNITCYKVVNKAEATCPSFEFINIDSNLLESAPDFQLYGWRTEKTTLMLDIGYSGCDRDRNFSLNVSQAQMRSMPPQNVAVLSFTPQMCEAYFRDTLCFEMSELGMETILLLHHGDSIDRVRYEPTP